MFYVSMVVECLNGWSLREFSAGNIRRIMNNEKNDREWKVRMLLYGGDCLFGLDRRGRGRVEGILGECVREENWKGLLPIFGV